MSGQVYSVPGQIEGGTNAFLEWTSIDLSSKLSLTWWGNVNYYKSVHYPIPTLPVGTGKALEIFKANQQALLSVECPGTLSSWRNWTREEDLFWRVQEEEAHYEITLKSTWLSKDEKVCPFVKFEIILPLLCCLLNPLTNKDCRTSISMINLWIDSRSCQKCRILLSARQTSNNYLEPSKENVLRNMMLSHWPCFTWKFFMIWFHKILKSIFQTQPSCHRNICTEHWRKLPNLTAFLEIFLYLKNNDSVEHVYRVLLIVIFIYFQGKITFSHCIWSI